jgi:hypothetical protein
MGCTATLILSWGFGARVAFATRVPLCCDAGRRALGIERGLQSWVRDRVSEAEMTDGKPAESQARAPHLGFAQRWDGRSTGFVSNSFGSINDGLGVLVICGPSG